MTTATAPETRAVGEIEAWNAGEVYSAIEDKAKDMVEGIMSVMTSDAHGIFEATEMLACHEATVCSGHGGRMTDVFGFQFWFKAPRDQFPGIKDAIEKKFSVVPPALRREDFPVVNKWIATHEVYFYKKIDHTGVLASVLEKLSDEGVNVVTIHAATGPGSPIRPGPDAGFVYWGQATVGVHIAKDMSAAVVEAAVKEVVSAPGDRVSITPIVKKTINGATWEVWPSNAP